MRMRRGAAAGVTALIALSLAACGGGDSGGSPSATSSGSGKLETTQLTVGALPIADYAALYWAQDKGFFQKEGLTVTLQPVQGGPIAAQQVAAGALKLSFSNTISTAIATQSALPIKTVVLTSALGPGGLAVYVKPDSQIKSLADLDGATVGINATKNIGDVALRNLLDSKKLNNVRPKFIEVPFPEMLAGVKAGSIDVGYSPEPFSSAALAAGMRKVADLADPSGPNVGLAVSNFIGGDQFIKDNPNTVAAFARAVYAAGGDIVKHEDEFRAWLPGIAHVPADVAKNMALPQFFDKVHVDEAQKVADLLMKQGLLKSGYEAKKYTYVPGDN